MRCGFVHFDDDVYVFENAQVSKGLTSDGLGWAFTTGHAANWHPVTWLSHMADVELFGLKPMGHHLTSLLLHALNAILLFFVLYRLTGQFGLSLVAAALWEVHPLRAESVVWIAERKDVLAMLFGLLALLAYGRIGLRGRMGWVTLAYSISLMSKPTWVTMPFLMVLLDGWPLRRWPECSAWHLIREKWPLLIVSSVSCVITFLVQQAGGAVQTFEHYPLWIRLANAVVAYGQYIQAFFWPVDLSFFYPHPGATLSWGWVWGWGGLLCLITLGTIWIIRSQPWFLMGWLWFLGSLVPMIGWVQVGGQAWADRYSMLPHVGLIVALVWGGGARWNVSGVARGLSMAGVAVLTVLSHRQTLVWRDSETLFLHALEVNANNALAHGNLGSWYAKEGRYTEALEHLRRSIEIQPRQNEAYFNLGNLQLAQGKTAEAIVHFRAMVEENPNHVLALNNLAWLLATDPSRNRAQAEEALALAQRAVACAKRPLPDILDTLEKTKETVSGDRR